MEAARQAGDGGAASRLEASTEAGARRLEPLSIEAPADVGLLPSTHVDSAGPSPMKGGRGKQDEGAVAELQPADAAGISDAEAKAAVEAAVTVEHADSVPPPSWSWKAFLLFCGPGLLMSVACECRGRARGRRRRARLRPRLARGACPERCHPPLFAQTWTPATSRQTCRPVRAAPSRAPPSGGPPCPPCRPLPGPAHGQPPPARLPRRTPSPPARPPAGAQTGYSLLWWFAAVSLGCVSLCSRGGGRCLRQRPPALALARRRPPWLPSSPNPTHTCPQPPSPPGLCRASLSSACRGGWAWSRGATWRRWAPRWRPAGAPLLRHPRHAGATARHSLCRGACRPNPPRPRSTAACATRPPLACCCGSCSNSP